MIHRLEQTGLAQQPHAGRARRVVGDLDDRLAWEHDMRPFVAREPAGGGDLANIVVTYS
jgi:hypothetical protein